MGHGVASFIPLAMTAGHWACRSWWIPALYSPVVMSSFRLCVAVQLENVVGGQLEAGGPAGVPCTSGSSVSFSPPWGAPTAVLCTGQLVQTSVCSAALVRALLLVDGQPFLLPELRLAMPTASVAGSAVASPPPSSCSRCTLGCRLAGQIAPCGRGYSSGFGGSKNLMSSLIIHCTRQQEKMCSRVFSKG